MDGRIKSEPKRQANMALVESDIFSSFSSKCVAPQPRGVRTENRGRPQDFKSLEKDAGGAQADATPVI
jgi:hypothetical protein